jgi:hypothetical protein
MSASLLLAKPSIEVGGKLSIRNLPEVKAHLRRWISLGFKKCQLLCFIDRDHRAQLFPVVVFCRKYIELEPDLVGWIRDEGNRIKNAGDMVFVRVDDADSRSYQVGILDQPKRRVVSIPSRGMIH